jgi:fatty acid desaturase
MQIPPTPETEAGASTSPDKSRFTLQKLLQPFTIERGIATPIIWFLLDWLVLGVSIASLLFVETWWVKVFASLVAALWIARLFVIGHDACHGSYTPNKTLNKWIGRIAFLPSLTPYSLWEIGHNLAHHGFTNLKGRDYVWTPYSPSEFARLPRIRRCLERIYRSGVGQGVYYMIEMWWKKLFFPGRKHVTTRRVSYTWDSLLVSAFGILWVGGLVLWGINTGRVAAGFRIRGAVLPVELPDGFRDLCAAHAPARRLVRTARRMVGERRLCNDHGAYQAHAAARWFDPLHSRARCPPCEHGYSAVSTQGGSGAPDRHSRRAAEFRSIYLALLLEHRAALQALRFRTPRLDRFRRPHHLGTAGPIPLAAAGAERKQRAVGGLLSAALVCSRPASRSTPRL